MEMEDYLYEKKKKFEMMKNRNRMKKSNSNLSNHEINLQTRQCERNILKTYDFKTKKSDLTPMKQKVMLKKKQSTEKSLTLARPVDDDSLFTNTIYLQEDEFNLDEKLKGTNLLNNSTIQNSDETIHNSSLEVDNIVISERDSSLNFQKSFGSSFLDTENVNTYQEDGANTSYGKLNKKQYSNSTITATDTTGKLQKKTSISSFLQKQTSGVFKKVRSFMQNSSEEEDTFDDAILNDEIDSSSSSKQQKNKSNKNKSNKNKSEEGQKSHKKTFSLSSFRLKSSKSNISIDNDYSNANANSSEPSKRPLAHRGSVTKSIMSKISSLSRKSSASSFSDDSSDNKKFSVGK